MSYDNIKSKMNLYHLSKKCSFGSFAALLGLMYYIYADCDGLVPNLKNLVSGKPTYQIYYMWAKPITVTKLQKNEKNFTVKLNDYD